MNCCSRTRDLARTAAERGVTLIDAPVSGGVAGAQSGSLTIMVGGPADVLDRLLPVLQSPAQLRAEYGQDLAEEIIANCGVEIAFAPKEDLQGGLLNCSAEGFAKAMDISCHSFIRMAKLAAPLMTDGGTMFAMSYYGANRVVANYNVMGPIKAALEAACRYLAYELGSRGIRVHAMSPGPLKTRAAAGLKDFELLLTEAAQKAPLGELVDIMDVGFTCAYLATPFAKRITGGTVYVDGGANLIA